MAMNSNYLDAVADYGASLVTHVALANNGAEISGGDYARQSITWGPADDGNIEATNQPQFEVPGSTTVNQVLFYGAAEGGTFYGYAYVTEETFNGAGSYTLSSATINHDAGN